MEPQVLTVHATDGKGRLNIDVRGIRSVGVRTKRDGTFRAYFDLDYKGCMPPVASRPHKDTDPDYLVWDVVFVPPEKRGRCDNARIRSAPAEEDD